MNVCLVPLIFPWCSGRGCRRAGLQDCMLHGATLRGSGDQREKCYFRQSPANSPNSPCTQNKAPPIAKERMLKVKMQFCLNWTKKSFEETNKRSSHTYKSIQFCKFFSNFIFPKVRTSLHLWSVLGHLANSGDIMHNDQINLVKFIVGKSSEWFKLISSFIFFMGFSAHKALWELFLLTLVIGPRELLEAKLLDFKFLFFSLYLL